MRLTLTTALQSKPTQAIIIISLASEYNVTAPPGAGSWGTYGARHGCPHRLIT